MSTFIWRFKKAWRVLIGSETDEVRVVYRDFECLTLHSERILDDRWINSIAKVTTLDDLRFDIIQEIAKTNELIQIETFKRHSMNGGGYEHVFRASCDLWMPKRKMK